MTQPAFFHDPDAPVQPDQFQVEFDALLALYRALKPRRVLEIGVREGGTLYQWIKHAPADTEFVAIDLPGVAWGRWINANPHTFCEWAGQFGSRLNFIRGDSHDWNNWAAAAEFAPFDFVFIDGDHSYNGVKADYRMYGGMLWPGGLLALHDILPDASDEHIEVWRLWEQLAGRKQELTSHPTQTSRGIGVLHV